MKGRKGSLHKSGPGEKGDYIIEFEDGCKEYITAAELHANDRAIPSVAGYYPREGVCYVGGKGGDGGWH